MWSAVKFKRSPIELITNTRRTNKKSVGVYFYDAITLSHTDIKSFKTHFQWAHPPPLWLSQSSKPEHLAVWPRRTDLTRLQHHKSISSNKTRGSSWLAHWCIWWLPGERFCMRDENRSEWDATLDYYANSKDWCGIDRGKRCCCVNTYSDHRVIKNNSLQ